jgi:hypothetical protein
VNAVNFLLYAGIVVICCVVLFVILRRMIDKRINPKAILGEIRKEVDGIITELNRTTDRNITIIEEKIRQIEEILEKTDKRIGILRRENEKLGMGKTYNDILSGAKPVVSEPPADKPEEKVRDKVIRYHREGFSPQVIASHIDMPVGEIELIISLERGNKSDED